MGPERRGPAWQAGDFSRPESFAVASLRFPCAPFHLGFLITWVGRPCETHAKPGAEVAHVGFRPEATIGDANFTDAKILENMKFLARSPIGFGHLGLSPTCRSGFNDLAASFPLVSKQRFGRPQAVAPKRRDSFCRWESSCRVDQFIHPRKQHTANSTHTAKS